MGNTRPCMSVVLRMTTCTRGGPPALLAIEKQIANTIARAGTASLKHLFFITRSPGNNDSEFATQCRLLTCSLIHRVRAVNDGRGFGQNQPITTLNSPFVGSVQSSSFSLFDF